MIEKQLPRGLYVPREYEDCFMSLKRARRLKSIRNALPGHRHILMVIHTRGNYPNRAFEGYGYYTGEVYLKKNIAWVVLWEMRYQFGTANEYYHLPKLFRVNIAENLVWIYR